MLNTEFANIVERVMGNPLPPTTKQTTWTATVFGVNGHQLGCILFNSLEGAEDFSISTTRKHPNWIAEIDGGAMIRVYVEGVKTEEYPACGLEVGNG
jgi:hypothetical protein